MTILHARTPRAAALFTFVALLAVGCHSGTIKPETAYLEEGELSEADRFLPLENNAVYRYDISSSDKQTGMMTIQIRHRGSDAVEFWFGGRLEHVRVDKSGIRFLDGGYLLKAPLSKDGTWQGRLGIVRVTDVDVAVAVPAGHFEGCIRTVERGSGLSASTTMTSVFCPHVGLAMLEAVSGRKLHEVAVLREFGPRADPFVGDTGVKPE